MRARLLPLLLAPLIVIAVLPAGSPTASGAPATPAARPISYTKWDANSFNTGTLQGTGVVDGSVRIVNNVGKTASGYEYASWISPLVDPGFAYTELVSSWNARTAGNSFIRVEVRGLDAKGNSSSWDSLGRWAKGDKFVKRSSAGSQPDDAGRVEYDTWIVAPLTRWQLRVTLFRKPGVASPRIRSIGAMASAIPASTTVKASMPGAQPNAALGKVLNVPKYSQMAYKGTYTRYGRGGEAWCSPTSTTMVLAYYNALPSKRATSWVKKGTPRPEVVHAARYTYDIKLKGTGNWPFNTAYAASGGRDAFVTRLRDLSEAERFIAADIPVTVLVAFNAGQLDGAPISSTNGHLLVIVGFTANGDVVVNDPAGARRTNVRRTYKRAQFENAWLKRSSAGGSGGIAYVIHPNSQPLPERSGATNW